MNVVYYVYVEARKYYRVFQKNPELLAQMLSLRLSGWGENSLSKQYRVDKTTIRHWCVKFNIQPKIIGVRISSALIVPITLPLQKVRKVYKYQHLFDDEDNVNPGKTYMEYVADHKKRSPSYKFQINPYAVDPDTIQETTSWHN